MAGSNGNSFWLDTMLPAAGTGLISTLSNLAIMDAQNKFNAREAQIARDWNLEQDNTKYQRAVVDMQKAGVNPALMMSKGPISTQAATNIAAQGATPAYMNMNAVASLAQTISQAKLNDAQKRNLDEDSNLKAKQARYYDEMGDKVSVETLLLSSDAKYRDEYNRLKIEGEKIANAIGGEQLKKVGEEINNLKADTAKKIEEAKTEQEKQGLYIQDAFLKKAQAYEIYSLVPFKQNLANAQSYAARASGKYQLVQAAYQKGLIDQGMVEAVVRQANASASKSEIDAIVQETLHALKFEEKQVNNTQSQTVGNYSRAVADAVNSIAHLIDAVIPF